MVKAWAVLAVLLAAIGCSEAALPPRATRALNAKGPHAQAAKDQNPQALKIFGVFPVTGVGFDMRDGGLRAYVLHNMIDIALLPLRKLDIEQFCGQMIMEAIHVA